MANKTAILILPGDPAQHPGGVIRHTYDVVQSSWNSRTKMLTSLVAHPSDPDVHFMISTSGVGCACTQGEAGNAGPISTPYKIAMVRPDGEEYDWFTVA
jgi:hypothetical protein